MGIALSTLLPPAVGSGSHPVPLSSRASARDLSYVRLHPAGEILRLRPQNDKTRGMLPDANGGIPRFLNSQIPDPLGVGNWESP